MKSSLLIRQWPEALAVGNTVERWHVRKWYFPVLRLTSKILAPWWQFLGQCLKINHSSRWRSCWDSRSHWVNHLASWGQTLLAFGSYSLLNNSRQLSWRIIFPFLRSQLSCHWPSSQFQLNYKVRYVVLNLQKEHHEHNHPPWNAEFKLLAESPPTSESVQELDNHCCCLYRYHHLH